MSLGPHGISEIKFPSSLVHPHKCQRLIYLTFLSSESLPLEISLLRLAGLPPALFRPCFSTHIYSYNARRTSDAAVTMSETPALMNDKDDDHLIMLQTSRTGSSSAGRLSRKQRREVALGGNLLVVGVILAWQAVTRVDHHAGEGAISIQVSDKTKELFQWQQINYLIVLYGIL